MGLLGKIFYKTGKASAMRPWTSIFVGLIIVAVGTLGFINFRSTVSTCCHWHGPSVARATKAIGTSGE